MGLLKVRQGAAWNDGDVFTKYKWNSDMSPIRSNENNIYIVLISFLKLIFQIVNPVFSYLTIEGS